MHAPLPAGRPVDRFRCLSQLLRIDIPVMVALAALLIIAVDGTNTRGNGVVLLLGGYLA